MADSCKPPLIAFLAAIYFVDVNANSKVVDLSCKFDIDLRNWYQDANDDLNWTVSSAGNYLFVISNGTNVTQNADLVSEMQFPGNYCMTFLYMMIGNDAKALTVFLLNNEALKQTKLWIRRKDENLSDVWIEENLSIESHQYFKVKVSGRVRGNWGGYIAVRCISFDNSWCAPVQTTSIQLLTRSATTPGWHTTPGSTSSPRTNLIVHTTNSTEKTEDNFRDEMQASGNGSVVAAAVVVSSVVAVIVSIFAFIIWRRNYGARMTHCWNKNADRKVESTAAKKYTYANTGTVLTAVNGQLQHTNDKQYVNFGFDMQEGNIESSFIAKNIKSMNDEEACNHLQAIKHPDNTDAEYSHMQSCYSGGNDKTYAYTNGSDHDLKKANDETYNTIHFVAPNNKIKKRKMKQDEDSTYDHTTTKRNMQESCSTEEYSHLEGTTKKKDSNTFSELCSEVHRGIALESAEKEDNMYFILEKQDDQNETEMQPDHNHEYFILEKIESNMQHENS